MARCFPFKRLFRDQEELTTPGAGPSDLESDDELEELYQYSLHALQINTELSVDHQRAYQGSHSPAPPLTALPPEAWFVPPPRSSISPSPSPTRMSPIPWAPIVIPGLSPTSSDYAEPATPSHNSTTESAPSPGEHFADQDLTSPAPASPLPIPIPTHAAPRKSQLSTFSDLDDAVDPFTGPLFGLARTVAAADFITRWNVVAERPNDTEGQPPLKRARMEEVNRVGVESLPKTVESQPETVEGPPEVSVSQSESGGAVGSGDRGVSRKEKAARKGRGEARGPKMRPWATNYRPIAPKPIPEPMQAAVGQIPMPVGVPQVYGNALSAHNDISTTSTHRVDNPAGEPVADSVPLSNGGPPTLEPAETKARTKGLTSSSSSMEDSPTRASPSPPLR